MAAKRKKVVVAMSGGVDSSVAAWLLVEQGYDVIGLFMRVGAEAREHRGCCSASDAADARFVAGMLGIPFYALNFQQDFDRIIDYFADEYVRGRTPNPCVVCNDRLKFGKLIDYADAVGARYIATGHYARIERHPPSRGLQAARISARVKTRGSWLLRGRDRQKDQSYVLFGLSRAVLDRVLFPIGDLTKSEVRKIATSFNLPNRDKPDSVEICFVPDRDYARVVRQRRPEAFTAGNVLDDAGRVVGRHNGIGQYTIGQRRGLGIAAGKPIYVTELDVLNNTVRVGEGDALLQSSLIADRANFLVDLPEGSFRAQVKIRYLHPPATATVEKLSGGMARRSGAMDWTNSRLRVVFDEPQRAITPGQAVVFYDGDLVLGGAWIERAESDAASPPRSLTLRSTCRRPGCAGA